MHNRWINNDELYHYGVKGMKWGVRKGNSKYYTNGRLNYRGKRAKRKAAGTREFANAGKPRRTLGLAYLGTSATMSYKSSKLASDFVHQFGNVHVMGLMQQRGESYNKRKAAAAAYIAGMGAVRVAAIAPYAKIMYRDIRYHNDDKYRNRIDELSELPMIEKKKATKR